MNRMLASTFALVLAGASLASTSFADTPAPPTPPPAPAGGVPAAPTPAYQKVLFFVDQGTSQVRRVLVVDGQGNRNRFTFDNPTVNVTVAPQQFNFVPPPGTSVVRP